MSKRKAKKNLKRSKRQQLRKQEKNKKAVKNKGRVNVSSTMAKTWKKRSLREQVKQESNRLKTWYWSQSNINKIALGLIIIPILIALFLLQGIILPFLATVMAFVFTFSKLAFIWLKGGAFIVYISYKIFKFLLGVYYCVSRSLTGLKAHRLRRKQASLPMVSSGEYPSLNTQLPSDISISVNSGWKKLTLAIEKQELVLIFSYLRYFIIGQIFMYRSFWEKKMVFLTCWKKESREEIKNIFGHVGKTIFTPHLLGSHLNHKRLLIPGDAKWMAIKIDPQDSLQIQHTFEVQWQDWSFYKKWPFLKSTKQTAMWSLCTPIDLAMLAETEIGYHLESKEVLPSIEKE